MAQSARIERVGLAGCNAVGQQVAMAIDGGELEVVLAAITSRNLKKARTRAASLLQNSPPVAPVPEAVTLPDLIVEVAPAAAFPEIARPTLEDGQSLLVLIVGVLLATTETPTKSTQERRISGWRRPKPIELPRRRPASVALVGC